MLISFSLHQNTNSRPGNLLTIFSYSQKNPDFLFSAVLLSQTATLLQQIDYSLSKGHSSASRAFNQNDRYKQIMNNWWALNGCVGRNLHWLSSLKTRNTKQFSIICRVRQFHQYAVRPIFTWFTFRSQPKVQIINYYKDTTNYGVSILERPRLTPSSWPIAVSPPSFHGFRCLWRFLAGRKPAVVVAVSEGSESWATPRHPGVRKG